MPCNFQWHKVNRKSYAVLHFIATMQSWLEATTGRLFVHGWSNMNENVQRYSELHSWKLIGNQPRSAPQYLMISDFLCRRTRFGWFLTMKLMTTLNSDDLFKVMTRRVKLKLKKYYESKSSNLLIERLKKFDNFFTPMKFYQLVARSHNQLSIFGVSSSSSMPASKIK